MLPQQTAELTKARPLTITTQVVTQIISCQHGNGVPSQQTAVIFTTSYLGPKSLRGVLPILTVGTRF